jgi:hypothetical protein
MARKLIAALALALVGATVLGRPASAAPTGIVIDPVVASSGSSVTVSGGGCTSAVHVTATGFLFPGSPSVTADETAIPAVDGTWDVTFPMPAKPSYVLAECDATTSSPVVVAPSNIPGGFLSPQLVTETDVVISTSPLVNGSTFAVYDFAGDLVASDTVEAGVGTVVVPRTLGEPSLLALALRQQDPGIALPYVPLALRVEMPLSATTTIGVSPAVTAAGELVVASGRCSGSPRLIVTGRPDGWYDAAPVYLDVVPAVDSAGSWSATFAMPPLPSIARISCTSPTIAELAAELISPSAGDLPSLVPELSGDLITVTLPPDAFPYTMLAYTSEGERLALSITNEAAGAVGWIEYGPRPARIVLIGFESLGENAEALQNSRVQAWTVDLPANPAPSPTVPPTAPPQVTPTAASLPLPDTDAATPPPGRPTGGFAALALIVALAGLHAVVRRDRRRA